MKTFYDQDWRFNKNGQKLLKNSSDALGKIFDYYLKKGFNPRDIAHICNAAILDLELEAVLKKMSK